MAFLAVVYATTGDWAGQDLDVYRIGGAAVLHGHALYDASFKTPTGLPFTYPPFAAILFVPLSLVRPAVALGLWNLATVIATGALFVVSLKAVYGRSIPRAWLPHVVLFSGMLATWLSPIQNCLFEGQVGAFLVLMCVADVAIPRPTGPRGVLVGIAAALKLTPALFVVYFAITRDWRAVRTSAITLAVCWSAAAIVAPRDSYAYFIQGIGFDSRRVGQPGDHLNESLNGLWHRVGVPAPTAFWLASALLVGTYGLWRAYRAHVVGDELGATVLVGLVTVLVSPISWLHHVAWVVPAIVCLARRVRTPVPALLLTVVVVVFAWPLQHIAGGLPDERGWGTETFVAMLLAMVMLFPRPQLMNVPRGQLP